MRQARTLTVLFVSLVLVFSTSAQQTSSPTVQPPQRDLAAVSAIQNTIAAMGQMPTDSTATGTITTVAGSQTEAGNVVILTRSTDQTSEQIQTSSGSTLAYSRGRASNTVGASLNTLPLELALTAQSAYFPLPLLTGEFANPDSAFKFIGLETLNGKPAQHVQIWNTYASIPDLQPLANFSSRDFWIDSSSGFPLRISFTRHFAGGSSSTVSVDVFLSDYRNVNGILYPFSIQVSLNGTSWATISIQHVTLNSGLSDTDFTVQ